MVAGLVEAANGARRGRTGHSARRCWVEGRLAGSAARGAVLVVVLGGAVAALAVAMVLLPDLLVLVAAGATLWWSVWSGRLPSRGAVRGRG